MGCILLVLSQRMFLVSFILQVKFVVVTLSKALLYILHG